MIAHLRDRPVPNPTLLGDTPCAAAFLQGDGADVESADPATGPSKVDQ
jgi:hypothetical protein